VNPVEHTDASGMTWRIEAAYEEAFRRDVLPRLGALADEPGVETVKSNRVRTVLRLTLAGGPDGDEEIYLKRYHPTGARATAKSVVRVSRARQEWTMARALEAAEIPTAHPIAWAERRRGRVVTDAAYVCRGLVGAVDFVPFLRTSAPDPSAKDHRDLRRSLLRRLARLARRQHDAGIDHPDLHSGNVLVTEGEDGPALHVIDLHGAFDRGRSLGVKRRILLLAKLLHSLREVAGRSARLRFLRRYAEDGGLPDVRAAFAATERRLREIERRRRRSRVRRRFQDGRAFRIVRDGGETIHHGRDVAADEVRAAIAAHDASLETGKGVIKRGTRSAVTRTDVGGRPVVVKSLRASGPRAWLGTVLGSARGRRSWANGHALLIRGIAAATPLAYVVERVGFRVRREVLVMEDVAEGGERLDRLVLRLHAEGTLHGPEGERLRTATARFVRDLHRGGIYHGDLKACNLYVQGHDEGAPALRLVDYDRVRFERPVDHRRRVKNLAQLAASIPICVTRSDRLRFFREYAPTSDIARDGKRYGVEVAAECALKIVVVMEPIE